LLKMILFDRGFVLLHCVLIFGYKKNWLDQKYSL
jgi:hypothetical protein